MEGLHLGPVAAQRAEEGEGEGIQDEDVTAGEADEQLEVVVVEGTDLTLCTQEEGGGWEGMQGVGRRKRDGERRERDKNGGSEGGREGGRERRISLIGYTVHVQSCKMIGVDFKFPQATTPAPSPLPLPTLLAQLWQATMALLCPSH